MTTAASIGTRDGLVEMLRVLDHLEPNRTDLAAAGRLECVKLARTLADRATTLAAVLVAEADNAKASEQVTGTAMTSWLAVDTGASKREAAGALKQGRALTAHPAVADAAVSGGIGAGQARSIAKVLDTLAPQLDEAQQQTAEQVMVTMAEHLDADGLAQAAPQVLARVAPATTDELLERKLQREAEQAHRERALRFYEVGGSIRFGGSLPKPVGRLWMGMIDTQLHATRRTALEERDRLAEPVSFEQRRADALALMIQQHHHSTSGRQVRRQPDTAFDRTEGPGNAERVRKCTDQQNGSAWVTPGHQQNGALGVKTGTEQDRPFGVRPSDKQDSLPWATSGDQSSLPPVTRGIEQDHAARQNADRGAQDSIPSHGTRGSLRWVTDDGDSRSSSDRTRVYVIIDHDRLLTEAAGAGLLNGVDPLSAGDLRRLCCDAGILPVVMSADSAILDLGQERRLVTPDLRAALDLRDRGCVMPGCDVGPVGCEAHHIVPWAAGGPTALHNLVSLCVQHHPRFEPAKNPLRRPWKVQIATDGIPEVIPPPFARLGDAPIRHQRFRTPPARAG